MGFRSSSSSTFRSSTSTFKSSTSTFKSSTPSLPKTISRPSSTTTVKTTVPKSTINNVKSNQPQLTTKSTTSTSSPNTTKSTITKSTTTQQQNTKTTTPITTVNNTYHQNVQHYNSSPSWFDYYIMYNIFGNHNQQQTVVVQDNGQSDWQHQKDNQLNPLNFVVGLLFIVVAVFILFKFSNNKVSKRK